MDNMERVRELLLPEELLCQLAEECSELGKAALKLRRVITGNNPTPISYEEARKNITEEFADVMCCLDCLRMFESEDVVEMGMITGKKLERWVSRLEERDHLEQQKV